MACWQCSVRTGGMEQHCGRCDCCRPINRPRPASGGGASGEKKGCALWTFVPIAVAIAILIGTLALVSYSGYP